MTISALEPEIDALLRGPLDTFVARRDALAKQLRAAGRRVDARAVKALRKPRRLAWALNVASTTEHGAVEAVAEAVSSTVAAQSGTGDLRAGLASLRDAVRNLAAVASRLAWAGEQSVDPGELADAVMAVIGSRDAFDLLRAGRLVDIPEAGGIELLSAAEPAASVASPGKAPVTAAHVEPEPPPKPDPAALEELRRAEHALTTARTRLATAEQALAEMEAAAVAAERRLIIAQTEAAARQKDVDRSRSAVDAAATAVAEAEQRLLEATECADRQ